MARKQREKYKGACYHVFNRGDEGNAIFADARDKAYFLGCLEEGVGRFSVSLYSFCIMSNHYHFALRTREENISEFMHFVGSSFGSHMSGRGWIGHVFAGRFKSLCVKGSDYFLVLNRYVHRNPVEAGLVVRPGEYPWSSYALYCGDEDVCPWVDRSWLLDYFGGTYEEARRRHRGFVEGALQPGQSVRAEILRDAIEGDARAADILAGRGGALRVSLDLVERAVLEHFSLGDMDGDDRCDRLDLERARRIFIYLSKESTNATNREISQRIGLSHPSGVTHRYKRASRAFNGGPGAVRFGSQEMLQVKRRVEELASRQG